MRRRFQQKTFDEINITPLMDTVFFLLIIFMITAPLLEYSFDVTPPAMKASSLDADQYSKAININKQGLIEFEKKILPLPSLLNRLREIKRSPDGKKTKIFLRGDKDLRYGEVIRVLQQIRQAGFTDVALVTGDEG